MQRSIHYPKITTAPYVIGSILMLLSFSASAMRVSPLSVDITTAGPGAKKTISVTNTESKPLPIELVITPVDLDSNGQYIQLTNSEIADDLMIFPPQTVIPPNKTQTFRIQWIGDPELPQSRGYSISINQVPVDITMPEAQPNKTNTAVQIVLSFGIFAAVRPLMEKAEFKLRTVELATTTDTPPSFPVKIIKKKGKNNKNTPPPSNSSHKIVLTVENVGNAHNYLCNAELTLQAGNWSKTIPPEELREIIGPGIVLPKHTRRFVLNINDLPANPGKITATIDMGERVGLPY